MVPVIQDLHHGTNCLNTQYASILRDVFVTHDMPAWGKSLFFQFAVLNKRNTQVYRVQYTWLYYFLKNKRIKYENKEFTIK